MDDVMSEGGGGDAEDKLNSMLEDLKEATETAGEKLGIVFEETWRLLRRSSLGPYHVLRSRLLNGLYDASIFLEKWEDSVAIGQESLPPLMHYLGNYHPSIGVLFLKIGKLQLYLERVEESKISLEKAEKILAVTHGRDAEIFSTLKQLLYSCRYRPSDPMLQLR